jgi:two-component system, sensor histidine kinase and response regulator
MHRLPILLFATFSFLGNAIAQEFQDSLQLSRSVTEAQNLYLSNPDSAISLSHNILQQALKSEVRYFEGYGYYLLSKAYWAKANYRFSVEYGFKALSIFENSPYINRWGECLLGQARSCIDLKTIPQARSFLNHAEQLARKHNNSELLAGVLRERSLVLLEEGKYDSALLVADKSLLIYSKNSDTLHMSILFSRKSKTHLSMGDHTKSLFYNRKALLMDSLVNNRRALGISYFQAAQIANHFNKMDTAILYLRKSFRINEDIHNLLTLIKSHDLLADIYLKQKKTEQAVAELKLSSLYKDTLYTVEKNGHIEEMQALYELEAKDRTIQMLGQENVLHEQQVKTQQVYMILLIGGILLLAAFIIVLYQLRRMQSKANEELTSKNYAIEHQKEEIHAQAENLQQLNQLKSKLFSVISHDLRGPISNLHAVLELVTKKALDPQEFLMLSEKLKGNLKVTQRTLENLLTWSLSQMEGIRTTPKTFALSSMINEVYYLLKESADRKNIHIDVNVSSAANVHADPNQVQLILRNLIHNAIKFSHANSQVKISSEATSTACIVRIKDFGIGMSSEEISIILHSQQHFTKNGTKNETGTGLGFILCKEFIHRNGGSLTIESKPEEGTEVSFTLPLA